MKKLFLFLTIGLFLGGCKQAPKEATTSPYQALADQYEEFTLTTDISKLTDKEKQMIPILIRVADIMEEIYWQEAFGDKTPLFQRFANDSAALKYISINYGPWDRLDDNKPFIDGYGAKPLGANFYPADMTKEEFEALADPNKDNAYSVIRRDADGKLKVIPYHEAFPQQIEQAASLLEQAADLAEDEGLRTYLTLRAKALRTDDYLESDLAWMDMKDNTIDFVVGPIETYEDLLFGYRASSSGQILVKDKEWSARLSEYAQHLPRLQEELPVPEPYVILYDEEIYETSLTKERLEELIEDESLRPLYFCFRNPSSDYFRTLLYTGDDLPSFSLTNQIIFPVYPQSKEILFKKIKKLNKMLKNKELKIYSKAFLAGSGVQSFFGWKNFHMEAFFGTYSIIDSAELGEEL